MAAVSPLRGRRVGLGMTAPRPSAHRQRRTAGVVARARAAPVRAVPFQHRLSSPMVAGSAATSACRCPRRHRSIERLDARDPGPSPSSSVHRHGVRRGTAVPWALEHLGQRGPDRDEPDARTRLREAALDRFGRPGSTPRRRARSSLTPVSATRPRSPTTSARRPSSSTSWSREVNSKQSADHPAAGRAGGPTSRTRLRKPGRASRSTQPASCSRPSAGACSSGSGPHTTSAIPTRSSSSSPATTTWPGPGGLPSSRRFRRSLRWSPSRGT